MECTDDEVDGVRSRHRRTVDEVEEEQRLARNEVADEHTGHAGRGIGGQEVVAGALVGDGVVDSAAGAADVEADAVEPPPPSGRHRGCPG